MAIKMTLSAMEEHKAQIQKAIMLLRQATQSMVKPMIPLIIDIYGRDPFIILIACLLSLRTKDKVTFIVCKKLFARARTPHELFSLPIEQLEKIIHSVNFHKRKAYVLHQVSNEILKQFNGQVPQSEEELLSLTGVGRKTTNLVLFEAFGIPAICVDTHVHRISNRLGWVKTKTPQETEFALQKLIPKEQWGEINYLLVMWGQNICVPISPWCSICVLYDLCPKIGVTTRR